MKAQIIQFRLLALCLTGLLISFPTSGYSQSMTLARRVVRFDGKPAAGTKVRVLSDYGSVQKRTDLEIETDAEGLFTVHLKGAEPWTGHTFVRAEGCATACEFAISLYRRDQRRSRPPELRLRAPFKIKGKTLGTEGRPVADATISLVSARPKHGNSIPFNSATTHLITTPEMIARSKSDGTWWMPGIDFVRAGKPRSARLVFEAATEKPLRASRIEVQIDPNPDVKSRGNISVDFSMAPLTRVAGSVVNSVTGKPVSGVILTRSMVFTTLAGLSAQTDEAGRFDLRFPGPLALLWFHVYRDDFATTTVRTAGRELATSEWPDTNDLVIRIRPLVEVSGMLLDESAQPPEEPLVFRYSYEEKIDARWDQKCYSVANESSVGPEGAFHTKLPAGLITLGLCRPLQQWGGMTVSGMTSMRYRLQQEVEIPAEEMKGLQLKASRIGKVK